MKSFDQELTDRLEGLREQGLHRQLRQIDSPPATRFALDGRPCVNFASNDYLGLANHPALKDAAVRAVHQFGAGASASRLICGSLAVHHELDEAIAAFKGTEAALSFSSGYAAALGAVCSLVGRGDIIIIDKQVHASLVDAARLCGAKLRVYAHNDLDQLADLLQWADQRRTEKHGSDPPAALPRSRPAPRILIVTESVFSMAGDHAPLRQIVELKERFGAWLLVDEAHATGLYGPRRRGLVEELGLDGRVEIQMGTLGKAAGSSGGYLCGSQPLIDCLVNSARSFIFTTAPVPAAAAAATAGLELIQSTEGEQRCRKLWNNVESTQARLPVRPLDRSAIVPILAGAEDRAVEMSRRLRELGLFVPAIRYPAVARGKARLRVTLSAAHQAEDVALLLAGLAQVMDAPLQ